MKQKSNFRTFEIFKFPLFLYNLSGKDSTKWLNRTLRNGGEPPVIYDSMQVDRTVSELTHVMNNKGYLQANVTPNIKTKGQNVNIVYKVKSGLITKIDNYNINIEDTIIASEVIKNGLRRRSQVGNRDSSLNINQILSYGSLLKKATLLIWTCLITNEIAYRRFSQQWLF